MPAIFFVLGKEAHRKPLLVFFSTLYTQFTSVRLRHVRRRVERLHPLSYLSGLLYFGYFLACRIGGADFERPPLFIFLGGGGWWLVGRNEGIFHLFLGGYLVTSRTATGFPPPSHNV